MPFCTSCGKQVADSDTFCAACGAPQTEAAATGGKTRSTGDDFIKSMDPRTAALLCYVPFMGWIACIIVLATQRFREDRTARFHAFQGLYLFVAWLIVDHVSLPFVFLSGSWSPMGILKALVLCAWVFMLYKTSQKEDFHLPLFGDLAEKSLQEHSKKY